MHEILQHLAPGTWVLDLGSGPLGSFQAAYLKTIRLDIDLAALGGQKEGRDNAEWFVVAEASQLPLADACVAAVICNHTLEHFSNLEIILAEIRRVLIEDGVLFASVPDSTTFADRYCRWALRGAGHVNQFSDAHELVSRIEKSTGLRHQGTRLLFSSLSILNPRQSQRPLPRRVRLTLPGGEWTLRAVSILTRLSDRFLGTRTSVYGWALYFGRLQRPVDLKSWCNVCIACGSATPSKCLRARGAVVKCRLLPDGYYCSQCQTWNLFLEDPLARHLS